MFISTKEKRTEPFVKKAVIYLIHSRDHGKMINHTSLEQVVRYIT